MDRTEGFYGFGDTGRTTKIISSQVVQKLSMFPALGDGDKE